MTADCPHFMSLLLDSLDEPLPADDQRAFDAHIAGCADCVVALREHVILKRTLADLDLDLDATSRPPTLSKELADRCLATLRAVRDGQSGAGRNGDSRTA